MKKVVIVLLKISHFIHNPCHHTVEINRCRFIYQKDKKKNKRNATAITNILFPVASAPVLDRFDGFSP